MATPKDMYKLAYPRFDSNQDPGGYLDFEEAIGIIVRAQGVHGEIMEDSLDEKLGREHIKAHVVPGFLMNDPDFAPTQDVAELQQHAMLHGGVATPMTVKSGASKKIESIYEAPKGTDGKKKASEEPSSSTLPVLPPTPQSAHRASIKRRQEQGGADQRHREQGGDEQQPPDRAAMAQQQLNMAAIRARLTR